MKHTDKTSPRRSFGSFLPQFRLFKKKAPSDKLFGPIQISSIDPEDTDPSQNSAHASQNTTQSSQDASSQNTTAQTSQDASSENTSDHYRFYSNRKYFTICVYGLFFVAAAALVIYAIINLPSIEAWFGSLTEILFPFLVAFFIAYLLNPLVKRIDQQLLGKVMKWQACSGRLLCALGLSYLIALGLLTIAIVYVFPQIGTSIMDLTKRVPDLVSAVIEFLEWVEFHFPDFNFSKIEEYITMSVPDLISYGTNLVKDLVPVIVNTGVYLVRLVINILLAVAISCYMLFDKRQLVRNAYRFLYSILPNKKAAALVQTAGECNQIFSGFIVGKSIDSLIIGILCFILMTIFGFPYAVLISVIVGVTNMIPYFGPFIGAVPGILLYLCIDPVQAFFFALMIFALQQFDGWFLGPKILGSSTGITPLWVIFGITVGGAYWGVLGMFLGVPVVAVIAHLCSKWIDKKLKKKNLDIR